MVEMREEARIFYERDKKFDDEVQVETGRKVSRGWQLIRDYVNKGIAERKLKRLLGV